MSLQLLRSVFDKPLVRQIFGALGGAAIALLLYGAYDAAAPAVTRVLHGSAPERQTLSKFFDVVAERAGK